MPYRPGVGAPPVRDAKVAAERWVRGLEEETGCVSISGAQVPEGEASGVASGSASITRRNAELRARFLPDFFIGSYENFVRTLAKENEARVGCVIIVSEEHDDTPEFKRWSRSRLMAMSRLLITKLAGAPSLTLSLSAS